ncbi:MULTISPECIES: peptidylprolyl isomerase [Sedimenticola]|uniref:Peptidyl-prolyl cis-trans isomerase n=1 Tax=Sedimenticola selenatireducens TaxID=191960 RepID=A0A2N6CU01_9GAMM|nr:MULTISPECIES: peptidylprolyl isomerase [Sedimenticola]MCW8902661.1 peptidylprolyl isomerase [Sedimenticola sp.]PLX60637.1 MAG: peptidylprolyl isomerase [Sedimenticola selenatireducens]
MSTPQPGQTVKVHYTGTLEDGTQFDSSAGRDPLEFTLGEGQVIPGFEQALAEMAVGETKTVQIPADQAYGEHQPELVQEVDRAQIPDEIELAVGVQLQAQGPDGQVFRLVVTELAEASVTLDGNHPLAGKALTFELELVEIAA